MKIAIVWASIFIGGCIFWWAVYELFKEFTVLGDVFSVSV
jgi:hypothetical protein